MRYIKHILQPDEKLLYSSTIHWIIYLPGIFLWAIGLIAFGLASDRSFGPIWQVAGFVCVLFGTLSLFRAWFIRWTTEIDVTDRRVVYKRGFIRRHTVEMNMDKIESVDVDQSVLGRLFNFGDITIRGTGIGLEPLHNIDDPIAFRNNVTAR